MIAVQTDASWEYKNPCFRAAALDVEHGTKPPVNLRVQLRNRSAPAERLLRSEMGNSWRLMRSIPNKRARFGCTEGISSNLSLWERKRPPRRVVFAFFCLREKKDSSKIGTVIAFRFG